MNETIVCTRIRKRLKASKWAAIVLAVCTFVLIIMEDEWNLGSIIDKGLFIAAIPSYFYLKKFYKNRVDQYIKWDEGQLTYKTMDEAETTIDLDKISSINIGVHKITIGVGDESYLVDISDFEGYEKRKRIKDNFNSLKTNESSTC